VNKTQLIDSVAEAVELPKNVAGRAVDAVLASITDALARGEDVALVGFATLARKVRAARTGRNPKTGAPLHIPESNIVTFKVGKGLKDAVNGLKSPLTDSTESV
jgi:DNA-binding protein HU-beta